MHVHVTTIKTYVLYETCISLFVWLLFCFIVSNLGWFRFDRVHRLVVALQFAHPGARYNACAQGLLSGLELAAVL